MTTREFQIEFERAASFHDKLKNIRINSAGIEYFLNEGQDTFVQTRLNNIKESIKDTQRNLDEIRPLIVRKTELTKDDTNSTETEYVYDLPANYLFLINDRSQTVYCSVTRTVDNRLVSSERIGEILNGTHTQSHYKSPVSELANDKLYVHLNSNLSFTLEKVIIDYIKKYAKINLFDATTSDLDDSVHRDIVQLGINIFLESVESGRFRTNLEKNFTTTQQIK